MVSRAWNPNASGGWGGQVDWAQEFENSLSNMVKPYLYKNLKKEPGVVVYIFSPGYSGDWGRRIAWAQEFEAAVSYACATALQPKW